MSGTQSQKPYYFDVMRPFGKDGYRNLVRFDYNGFENRKLSLFDPDSPLKMQSLPYAMTNRFIELLPSQALRLFSFTSKRWYSECLSTRGIEVQVLYPGGGNLQCPRRIFPLENGKLIVEMMVHRMTETFEKMIPFFQTVAFLCDLINVHPENKHLACMPRNYKHFYGVLGREEDVESLKPFLHDGLDTVEFKINFGDEFNYLSLCTKFEDVKVKHFSLEIHTFLTRNTTVDGIKQKLVEHRPKADNLYFCFSNDRDLQYGNNFTISVYDEVANQWIVQAVPDERSEQAYTVGPMYTTEFVNDIFKIYQIGPRRICVFYRF